MQLHTELKRGPRKLDPIPIHAHPDSESLELANVDDLRCLMTQGAAVSIGKPWAHFNAVMDTAREVRAASVGHKRFSGAEVDLVISREIRAISDAAERAANNLRQMLAFLKEGI